MIRRWSLITAAVFLTIAPTTCPARTSRDGVAPIPQSIQALYDAGEYHKAEAEMQREIDQDPKDGSLYFWLGRTQFELRDFSHSIASFEQAVALDPERSDYHDWLGRACGRRADESSHSNMPLALSMARRTHHEFEVAARLDPANIGAQRDLIEFMANAPRDLGGGEARALEQIRALSSIDPLEADLAKADLDAVQKKFDQADKEYQRLLDVSPGRISAVLEVADYYRDRGDSERTKQAVEAATRIDPSDRRLSYYHGVALVMEKTDLAGAEEDLRAYLEKVPENSEFPSHSSAHEWLGKLYQGEDKPGLAAEQYQAGLTLDPHNKTLRESLKKLQKP